MALTVKINGEDVWHSADDIESVSLRSRQGEAGALRVADHIDSVDLKVQTRQMSDLDLADEDPTGPSANAGDDLTCVNNELITMTGTGSEGSGTETYQWEQVSGPTTPSLTNATTATCTWTSHATIDGTYVFKLTVTDDAGRQDHDYKVVVVA